MEPRSGYPGGLRLSPRAAAPVKVAPRPTQPRLRLALKDGLKARVDPEGGPEPRTVARGGEEPTSAARTPPASTKGRLTGVMPT